MSWTTDKTRIFTPALESGTLDSSGIPQDNHARVRTAEFSNIYISECQIVFSNQELYCNVFQYNPDGTYVSSSGFKKGIYTFRLTQPRKIKVIFSKDSSSSGTSWIDVSEVTGFHIFADYGDVQFSQDDEQFFGLPFLTESGIVSPFNGKNSVWTMDRDFWGFPHVQRAGVNGISKIYLSTDKVKKFYLGANPCKHLYLGDEIVFKKG